MGTGSNTCAAGAEARVSNWAVDAHEVRRIGKIILFQGVVDYGGLNRAHINHTMC